MTVREKEATSPVNNPETKEIVDLSCNVPFSSGWEREKDAGTVRRFSTIVWEDMQFSTSPPDRDPRQGISMTQYSFEVSMFNECCNSPQFWPNEPPIQCFAYSKQNKTKFVRFKDMYEEQEGWEPQSGTPFLDSMTPHSHTCLGGCGAVTFQHHCLERLRSERSQPAIGERRPGT